MILQEILFDSGEYENLCFRVKGKAVKKKNKIIVYKNSEIKTDTYYNSFSVGKWVKYCNIYGIKLAVLFEGKAGIKIIHTKPGDNSLKPVHKVIFSREVCSDGKKETVMDLPSMQDGSICFSMESLSDEIVFYGARYMADCGENVVRLALNICTYKREKELFRNLELIRRSFLENPGSQLYGRLKVFIIDNGNTLNIKKMSSEDICVVHNPNLGGAGGFSRGLLEILKVREKEGITNVIFMDDDVVFEPEAVLRTYRLLCGLKEEYNRAFIAGAMLLADLKYVQYENGAIWNGGKWEPVNRGLDLRKYRNVVYNECEKEREYAAWWYCCIPADIISENNLAMPLFIHRDDIEYSLRNTAFIITMNGIAVGHAAMEQKVSSVNTYYDVRNTLIVNSRYGTDTGTSRIKKELFRLMLDELLRYRYRNVKMLYCAVADYCKGPDWLMDLDAAEYHQKLRRAGYRLEDVSAVVNKTVPAYPDENVRITDFFVGKRTGRTPGKMVKVLFHALTLNGWFLPPKEKGAFTMNVSPSKLYRRKEAILYDDKRMLGIPVRRDVRQIAVTMALYVRVCLILDKQYHAARAGYRKMWEELHGNKYWGKFPGYSRGTENPESEGTEKCTY